jgi:hypothetical protein
MPCHASPSLAEPSLAVPRRALPSGAAPSLALLAYLISPGRPTPGNRSRSPGFDFLAPPRPASPCHAVPCLAPPCQARPRHAIPRWPISSALDGHPRGRRPAPPFRLHALPRPAMPRHPQPSLARPRLATPRHASLAYLVSPGRPTPGNGGTGPRFDSLPRLALPRHTMPCRTGPRRAEPSHAWPRWPISSASGRPLPGKRSRSPRFDSSPRQVLPCHASPGQAVPFLTPPSPARPRRAALACLFSPGRPTPGDGGRSPRFNSSPCPAGPNLAAPRRASASPRHAQPSLVGLSRQPWATNPRGRRPKPPFRFLATPCQATPNRAPPGHARAGLTSPCHAAPRRAMLRHSSSQTSPRQSGGMMPSLRADAIMPRCRLSARRTWHRRHSVRSSDSLLPPSLPLLMWSIWHSSKLRAAPQWMQRWPSRSQAWRRCSSHISRGGRCLGTATSYPS